MADRPLLGFVLLTHERPKQVLRLINRLNVLFDYPPISCHHDFSACDLPKEEIPGNVTFVRPHLKTAWGHWSLVEATMRAMKLLFERPDAPEWFILLSGTDYPIKPPDVIRRHYRESTGDAWMNTTRLVISGLDNELKRKAYERYRSIRLKYPSIFHFIHSVRIRRWYKADINLKRPIYNNWSIPFNEDFVCFMGDQWFSARRKAAEEILRFDSENRKVRNHYRRVQCPDESYFHTILKNSDRIKVDQGSLRYVEWVEGSSNPKWIEMEDLPKLERTSDHFARKFDMSRDSEVLDKLDEMNGYLNRVEE
jgi:hypothetical protein